MRTQWKDQLGLGGLALLLALSACGGGSKDEAPPKKDAGGSFTDEDDAGGDDEDAAAEDEDAAAADAGSDAATEETAQASKAEATAKGWVEGCYKKPSSSLELLNSCATGWRKFDKTLYPSSWKEGQALPALP